MLIINYIETLCTETYNIYFVGEGDPLYMCVIRTSFDDISSTYWFSSLKHHPHIENYENDQEACNTIKTIKSFQTYKIGQEACKP